MKKVIIVFCFFIFSNQYQLARIQLPRVTNLFNNSFLKQTSPATGLVKRVSLFSQVPLSPEVENRIFRLKLEDGVSVSVLTTNEVFEKQKKSLIEMCHEGCVLGLLPDNYATVTLPEDLDPEKAPFLIDTQYNEVKESLMVALLQYHTEFRCAKQTQALLCTHDSLVNLQNYKNDFQDLQNWFDELAENSEIL